MGLDKPQQLLGYLAVKPDSEIGSADIIAVNRHFQDTENKVGVVHDPDGLHLFNTQEALTASLNANRSADLTYAWEVNEDNLDARPHGRGEWLRSAFWRPPRYGGGTKLHGPSLVTTVRYQIGRANYLIRNLNPGAEVEPEPATGVAIKEEATERPARLAVPPRRLSVFTGVLYRLGEVQELEE